MTLASFLTTELKNSVEKLVRNLVAGLKKAAIADSALATMVDAAVTVLNGLDRKEEVRLLGLLVVCHYGNKEQEVPEAIAKMFIDALPAKPATAPVKPVLIQQPSAKPAVQSPTPKPVIATSVRQSVPPPAPARVFDSKERKPFSPENSARTWRGFMGGIIKGSIRHGNQSWSTLRNLTTSLSRHDYEFLETDFTELLFPAMKIADEMGDHIVENDANPAKLFAMAPPMALDDLLFGQDGLVARATKQTEEKNSSLPPWFCAKMSIIVDAILVADTGSRLGEQEVACVNRLFDVVEAKNPPSWLTKKIEEWGDNEPIPQAPPATEKVGNGGARIVGNLSSVVRANGNVHKANAEEARLEQIADNAKATATAFSAAIN